MFISRQVVAAVLGCLLFASAGQAQVTIETYAGDPKLENVSASSVPIWPHSAVPGPDGHLYVNDYARGVIFRVDLSTSIATLLRDYWGNPIQFGSDGFGFDASGNLHVADYNGIYRVNLLDGTRTQVLAVNGIGFAQSFAFNSDGRLFIVRPNNSQVIFKEPWTQVTTLAGNGSPGFDGDGGPSNYSMLNYPRGVFIDSANDVYIADTDNNRIRKVDASTGIITTVVGTGISYFNGDDRPALETNINRPYAVAVDGAGNVFVSESTSARIRRIDAATGLASTVIGQNGPGDYGDGGPASEAAITVADHISLDAAGNLYISDSASARVRRVDAATGIITTVIGNGTSGFCAESSPRRDACLRYPNGVAVNSQGDLFISDSGNQRIRRVSASTGELTTYAGNGVGYTHEGDGGPAVAAAFGPDPAKISFDAADNLYVAGGYSHRVRRIDAATGVITTIAGSGVQGFTGDGGAATLARLSQPNGVLAAPNGDIYIADSGNNRVRKISAATGVITTIAGNGLTTGPLGDGGQATAASLYSPEGLELDPAGNLLIVDSQHRLIRKVTLATGIITTVAGNGSWNITGTGGPAIAAGLGNSPQITLDRAGNIFVTSAYKLRRIDAVTGIISSIDPPWGLYTPEGTGLQYPTALVFDALGQLYISDANYNVVFRVNGIEVGAAPDVTPPDIQPNVSGLAGNGDWYRSNVHLTWIVSDPESSVSSSNGCSESFVTEDTAGVTFTCAATSAGGTATRSVTVRRDTVAPVVNFIGTFPEPDALGWFHTNVAVDFWSDDALSGVYSESTTSPLLLQQEGNGVTGQLVVTDRAGNSTTYNSAAYNIDKTPPSIYSNRPGPVGSDDWYTENVQINYTVEDSVSPIRSQEGCDDPVFSTDSPGTVFTCTATSAGGTTTSTMTLKRDATPPTLVFGAPSPAPNGSGWHSGDVSFPFTTSDGTSGVAGTSSSGPVVITGEGEGLIASVTVTDAAGNSASFTTPPVNIARSPPAVQPVINGVVGNNGWYTGNVQVSWNVTGSVQSSNGCDTSNVTTDTAGVTFTCTATSAAGSTSNSITVKHDATPPVLSFGTPSPAANVNGWNKTNVSISFTRSDALSGLASTSITSPLVISTEGAGVTGQVVVTDLAGNTATFVSVPRNIDKAAPVVAIASPANGANYGFYQDVIGDFSCTDLSLLSCVGTTENGAPVNTKIAGARTFKVTGKDLALFTTAVTHSFTVESLFNFAGFLAPANDPPTLNLVARGSLVPIRWQLPDGNGGFVSNPASFTSATVASLTCGSAPVVPYNNPASGPAGIDFDPATNTFTYNWQTTASWTGCRKLTIKLRDNTLHELRFRFQ